MLLLFFLAILLVVVVWASSCTENLTEHRVYRLNQGETMLLELPGNATTGHQWHILRKEGHSVTVETPFRYTIPPTNQNAMVGVPGFFLSTITAVHKGRTRLFLVYDPPGTTLSEPSLTIDFLVHD